MEEYMEEIEETIEEEIEEYMSPSPRHFWLCWHQLSLLEKKCLIPPGIWKNI